LYPHLIMQYNISPETYRGLHPVRTSDAACDQSIDEILDGAYNNIDNPEDNTIGGSGAMYTKDFRGFLPTLMEKTYADRVVWKNKLNEAKKSGDENEISRCDNMQMAKKIQLNSAYGALANPFFRWFKLEYAESITASGQLSIRWIEKKINEWMNVKLKTDKKDYVVAIDTDSVYVSMKDLVTEPERGVEQLHNFTTDTFEPLINKWYAELAEYTNAYAQRMVMKREVIADRGVWTSKKHYALNVWDMEGFRYKTPQQKVMGLEVVRSSTPNFCRVAMKSALRILLNENEARFIEFIENFRKEFFALPFEDIAFPRGVSDIAKWQQESHNRFLIKKGCPIHVRGSITFNNMLLDHDLIGKYDLVNQGDKIKFAYLKLPNPSREHVISVPSTLPKQFGLDKYIDYEKQFSKSFLDPIKTVADAAEWKVEHMLTLEDFWT
jgi:DNA polymerase elongation subunit (family B)